MKSWEKITLFAEKYHMLEKKDSVLIGLSGGADSVCLARYLLARRTELSLKLYAVHVNHMLRDKEAGRDEAFVREFCEKWRLPLMVVKRDIRAESRKKRCSEEEAGRIARYECFEESAGRLACGKIAVAHHKNDAAETILFRIARGSGVTGIAGISPVNGKVIRPLLCLRREEITGILAELDQSYVEDGTNACEEYSRNFIRSRILPEMTEVNERATEHICRLGFQVQELLSWLKPEMDAVYEESVRRDGGCLFFPEEVFLRVHPFVRKEILRRMLFETAGRQRDLSFVHVEQLLALMDKREGKRQDYPYGMLAVRRKDGIVLGKAPAVKSWERMAEAGLEQETGGGFFSLKREMGGGFSGAKQETGGGFFNPKKEMEPRFPVFSGETAKICLQDRKLTVTFRIFSWDNRKIVKKDCVKYFDYDKIECKMCLRTRIAGDYFVMDKEGRKKTLHRYFIDAKIPASDRNGQLLLADGSHIMWVVGGRISEFYKVSRQTKRALEVSVNRAKEKEDGGC